jgi:hypothetical protein
MKALYIYSFSFSFDSSNCYSLFSNYFTVSPLSAKSILIYSSNSLIFFSYLVFSSSLLSISLCFSFCNLITSFSNSYIFLFNLLISSSFFARSPYNPPLVCDIKSFKDWISFCKRAFSLSSSFALSKSYCSTSLILARASLNYC